MSYKKSEMSYKKSESSYNKAESSDKKSESGKSKSGNCPIRIRTVNDINENSDRDLDNMSPISITHETDNRVEPQDDCGGLDDSVVEITPSRTEKTKSADRVEKSSRTESDHVSRIVDKSSNKSDPTGNEKSKKEKNPFSSSKVRIRTVEDINEHSDEDFGYMSPVSITREVEGEDEEKVEEEKEQKEKSKKIVKDKDENNEVEKEKEQSKHKEKETKVQEEQDKTDEEEKVGKNDGKDKNCENEKNAINQDKETDDNSSEDESNVEITPVTVDQVGSASTSRLKKRDGKKNKTYINNVDISDQADKNARNDLDEGTLAITTGKKSKDGADQENSAPRKEVEDESGPDDIIVEITEEICVKKPKILEGVSEESNSASEENLSDCNLDPERKNQDDENSDIFADSDTADPTETANIAESEISQTGQKLNEPKVPSLRGKMSADKMKKLKARLGEVEGSSEESDQNGATPRKIKKSTKDSDQELEKISDQVSANFSDRDSEEKSARKKTANMTRKRDKSISKNTDSANKSDEKYLKDGTKKKPSAKLQIRADKGKNKKTKKDTKEPTICPFTSTEDEMEPSKDLIYNGKDKDEKKKTKNTKPVSESSDDAKEKLNEEAKAAVLKSSSSENEPTVPRFETSSPRRPGVNQEEREADTDLDRRNENAKAAVLQSTSSDNEPTNKIINEDESSPRKKLKTKRELDKIRRKSGQTDNLEDTSDEEDLNDRRSKKRKTEDHSPEQKKKQKVGPSSDEESQEDEKNVFDYNLSDIDIENLRPCRVQISRLSSGVRRELRKFRKVGIFVFLSMKRLIIKIRKEFFFYTRNTLLVLYLFLP